MTKHKSHISGYKRSGSRIRQHNRRGSSVKGYQQSRASGKTRR